MKFELDGKVFDTDEDLALCGQCGEDVEGYSVRWNLYQKATGQYYIYSETLEEPDGKIEILTPDEAEEIIKFATSVGTIGMDLH